VRTNATRVRYGGTPISQRHYSALGRSEKSAVIVDIGESTIQCGFAKEVKPRVEIPTPDVLSKLLSGGKYSRSVISAQTLASVPDADEDIESSAFSTRVLVQELWLDALLELFQEVYFVHLQTKPRERRVHLAVRHYAPSAMLSAAAEAVLGYFHAPSIYISSCSGLALFPTARRTGLVVDIGASEARCVAIVDNACIDRSFRACGLEGASLEALLEDNGCSDDSIAQTALEALLASPRQARVSIMQNVCTCGGGSRKVLDINARLVESMQKIATQNPRYEDLREVVQQHGGTSHAGLPPHLMAWIGASVASSLDSFFARSVTLPMLREKPFIFDSSHLDWSPTLLRKPQGALISDSASTTSADAVNTPTDHQAETNLEDEAANIVRYTIPAPERSPFET